MKPIYKLIIITVFCSSASYSFAQTDTSGVQKDTTESDTTQEEKKAYLKVGANYINNNVYFGRTDTITSPIISPTISYTFKSGIYFSGSLEYITTRKNGPLDGGNIEAGYNYSIGDNIDGGVSFTKLFFNSASTQVSSSVSSIINANIDYSIADIVTPAINVSYSIVKNGGKGDIAFNPTISHDFLIASIFGDNDEIIISPQVGLNAGSQNFYAEYLVHKGKLKKGATIALTNYSNSLGDFKLLDYEITAPIEYKAGHFMFSFIPTYAFAQNSLPQSTPAEKLITANIEKGAPYKSSQFYFQTGISFKF